MVPDVNTGVWASITAFFGGAPVAAIFILISIFVLLFTLRKAGQVTSRYLADR